jgi:small GTP-binding protein
MVDGRPVNPGFWDTNGSEEDARLRHLSYPQTDVFMLCFAIDQPTSFFNISKKWVPEVRAFSKESPFILVGTKLDLRNDPAVCDRLAKQQMTPITTEQGRQKASEIGALMYVECSALTQEGLKNAFDCTFRAAITKPHPNSNSHRRQDCVVM